jgi:hypothetical protein
MLRVSWSDTRLEGGSFYNKILFTFPCFVHFNGNSHIIKNSERSIIPIIVKNIKNQEDCDITEIKGGHTIFSQL